MIYSFANYLRNNFVDHGIQGKRPSLAFPRFPTSREGVNREKLTVKKIVNNEIFFFTVDVPYKP